jgi:hypothetical protein
MVVVRGQEGMSSSLDVPRIGHNDSTFRVQFPSGEPQGAGQGEKLTFRNEKAFIDVVLSRSMGTPKGRFSSTSNREVGIERSYPKVSPSATSTIQFSTQCVDVWETRSVVERWKSLSWDDSVKLCLCMLLHIRIENKREKERR